MKPSVTEFRFAERKYSTLSEALQLPHKTVCCQETVANNIEALCISLKSLSCPCRLSDMAEILQKFVIFNYMLDHIYSKFNQLLSSWNQDILQPNKLALYCNVIHWKGALLQKCFGFVDGTVLRISRPKINQNIVYNGHKRVHGIKFQSLAVPKDITLYNIFAVPD